MKESWSWFDILYSWSVLFLDRLARKKLTNPSLREESEPTNEWDYVSADQTLDSSVLSSVLCPVR